MRKSTLLTVAFAFASVAASADEKIVYQDNFLDKETTLAGWSTSRANSVTKFVETPDGNYIQFGDGSANYNGTRHSSIWGLTPWEGVELPEDGYTMTFSFNFAQFGNNTSNAAQRNNEIAVIGGSDVEASLSQYYGNSADILPNYLFKITHCPTGDAAGDGGYATSTTGTCYFTINKEEELVNVAAGTWYIVTLNVVGNKVSYDISDISGAPLKNGEYTLPDGADNRAAGLIHYQARYLGITQMMNFKISYMSDEVVANKPAVSLYEVQRENRVYKATFAEGETLHYVLPGEAEQEVDYWDAEDELTGNPGTMKLIATQSGTLRAWTTKGDVKSDEVEISVECGLITLVDPVASIASVSEGFGKSYTISIDNSKVLLAPQVALTYTINYTDGEKLEGEIANGGTLELTKEGTMVVTANTIPVNGVEYYERSSVTINNDVEYVVAQDVNYQAWSDAELAKNPAFEKDANGLVDTNTSHWIGHWMNTKDENGNPLITDPNTPLPLYNLLNDEAGVNYATALLPLKMNTARGYIAILLEEGVFINSTSYNSAEVYFDENYITDDPAKPNFIAVYKTGSYDRYDRQETCHTVDILNTEKNDYSLWRYDTAINRVVMYTYKGFKPGSATAISNVNVDKANADAPVYDLRGMRVNKASLKKGVYIQNGKKFVVK